MAEPIDFLELITGLLKSLKIRALMLFTRLLKDGPRTKDGRH
jgi:hypothetical protein